MQTLLDFLPQIQRLRSAEAVRWSNGFRTWIASYSDLYGKIGSVVRHFEQHGIRQRDRVLLHAQNRPEWVAVFWACVARGIEAVPVDFRFSADLVERIRRESRARLVIDDAMLDEIAGRPGRDSFEFATVSPDDIVEIVYTSGTTGEPKGVVHRHRNLCANLKPFEKEIAKYRKWARPFQPIRILNLLPLSHIFGQALGLFIPVLLEGAVVFSSEIHPGKITQLAKDNRVSVMVCVPRILENLKNETERKSERDPTAAAAQPLLRMWRHRDIHRRFGWKFWAFVVGGARVEPQLEEFWKRRGFAVLQGYGLTEASLVIAVNHPFNARTGSVGKVIDGQQMMIAPDGEILVKGENVTAAGEEWLHTGDLGEIDSEGRLYFRGRKKNVIVTAEGLNVYPEDIEAVLNAFPEVRDSAVIGPDEVHAVVILEDPQTDLDDLVRRANSRLEAHQRLQRCSVWPDAEFPRTPSTLKLKRHEIAAALRSKSAGTKNPANSLPRDLSSLSSLERVELLSQLEDRHQVQFDEDAFARLGSTRELEAWLKSRDAAEAHDESRTPLSDWARSLPVHWLRNAFQHALGMPLYRHYIDLTVTGLDHLKDLQPPVIFAANHISHLDVPTLYAALPTPWRRRLAPAMMKDHFRSYFEPKGQPFQEVALAGLSYFLACSLYNAYPLPQRMSGTRRALAYTGALVQRGWCPLVFPEGLRTPDGRLQEFRPGIGLMAVRLQVPVVPLRLSGLYEIYSVHDSWPRRGPVRVDVGAPLSFGAETTYEEAAGRVKDAIVRLGG